MLLDHYYESVASMNEMGAAWVLQKKYTIVLLPGFEFKEIKGAINPRQIGLKLDNDLSDVKEKLGQLKDTVVEEFGLEPIRDVRWEEKRDIFIDKLSKVNVSNKSQVNIDNNDLKDILSKESITLLQAAVNEDNGTIIIVDGVGGEQILVGETNFIPSQKRRDIAKWERALSDLSLDFYIKCQEDGRYVVTQKGYDYIDKMFK